jgi:long-chain fatty acid transport protein
MECEIRAWRVAPALAFRLADRLAVGGGADVLLSKFSLTRRMVANPNPSPDTTDVAETTVKTDTTVAVGWNLGLLASPTEKLSVGLAYHNRINVTHGARASFDQILTGDEAVDTAVAEGLPEGQVAEVAFTYPGKVVGGVAWHGDRLTVEGDVTCTLWSTFDRVLLSYRDTELDSYLPADFSNTWKLALGAEYLLRDEWAVRGGYSFETSPQPDSSLSPFYDDSRRHALSLGGAYIGDKLRLDAAVRLILRGSRQTDGANDYGYEAIYNQASSFAAGLSLGYRF